MMVTLLSFLLVAKLMIPLKIYLVVVVVVVAVSARHPFITLTTTEEDTIT
jgi:hypothetical protein